MDRRAFLASTAALAGCAQVVPGTSGQSAQGSSSGAGAGGSGSNGGNSADPPATLAIGSSSPLPSAAVGAPYVATLTAVNGVSPYTWSMLSAAPNSGSWLSINSSAGALTGTPGTAETESVAVQVKDSSGATASQTFSLTVQTTLTITTSALTDARVGSAYSSTLTAINGVPPYTWSITSDVPNTGSWLLIAPTTGVLSGTPGTAETETVTIKVTDSAAHTASATFSLVVISAASSTANPIGTNFAAGGASALSYEAFPIFKNRVRESRGFTTGTSDSYNYAALDANGWPSGTDGSFAYCLLFEGMNTVQTWATANGGVFTCGFTTSSATPSVTGTDGGTASGLKNIGGNNWTFNLTYSGGGTLGFYINHGGRGAQNIFAYLPEYPGTSIDNTLSSSAFTTEAINFYRQFHHIRWMWWSDVVYNTGLNTASTRNTSSNTQAHKGWVGQSSGNNVLSEGYPADWAMSFCNACNIGIWYNLPVQQDGAKAAPGSYSTSLLTMFNTFIEAGYTQPIYLEIGNELWNGAYDNGFTGGGELSVLAANAGFGNSVDGASQYLGYQLHALADICRTIFGSKFGTQVNIVLASQAAGGGWGDYIPATLNYMSSNYGTPRNDIQYLALAPYINLYQQSASPWNYSNSMTVAQIEANLMQSIPSNIFGNFPQTTSTPNPCESYSISAQHWGMGLLGYEAGWQVNSEGALKNISAATMDSGMTAVMEMFWTTCLNSGIQYISNFESGVDCTGDANDPVDELSNNYASLISTGSPRSIACFSFASGSYAQTRNVISAHGQAISGGNYADALGAPDPTFSASNDLIGDNSIAWQLYCTDPGSYSMVVAATSSCTVSVEVNAAIVSSSYSLTGGSSSGLGVTLKKGFKYVVLSATGGDFNTAVQSLTFN